MDKNINEILKFKVNQNIVTSIPTKNMEVLTFMENEEVIGVYNESNGMIAVYSSLMQDYMTFSYKNINEVSKPLPIHICFEIIERIPFIDFHTVDDDILKHAQQLYEYSQSKDLTVLK